MTDRGLIPIMNSFTKVLIAVAGGIVGVLLLTSGQNLAHRLGEQSGDEQA